MNSREEDTDMGILNQPNRPTIEPFMVRLPGLAPDDEEARVAELAGEEAEAVVAVMKTKGAPNDALSGRWDREGVDIHTVIAEAPEAWDKEGTEAL